MKPEPTNLETEIMQYLVAALGGHSVVIVRHEPVGVEKLLGFSVGRNRSFAIRDLLDRVAALTVKPHWEVEEFKIWKGIDEKKPCWSGLNIVTDDWHEANSYVEYLAGNKPDGVFRVAFAKFQPLRPAAEHNLYKTGDADAPDVIKDRNGDVALNLCRSCGKGEAELSGPCERKG